MVIEADQAICDQVFLLTQKVHQFDFIQVSEPAGALETIKKERPLIIIADLLMEGLDMVSIMDFIRQTTDYDPYFIATICHEADWEHDGELDSGIDFFITKSHIYRKLSGILRMVVRHEGVISRLTAKQKELNTILDNHHDMICRFLPDTTLTYVNSAYARMFNKSPRELIGIPFIDLIPEEDKEGVIQILSKLGKDNPTHRYRHKVFLPDKQIGWQEWVDTALLTKDGQLIGFQSMGRDITHQIKIYDALEKSEEKERAVIARELHDHIGQMLILTKLRQEMVMRMSEEDKGKDKAQEEVLDLIIQAMIELRAVSRRMTDGSVRNQPFKDTVTNLIFGFERMSLIRVRYCIEKLPENLSIRAENHIFRILEEAFTNISKHSGASKVYLHVFAREHHLHIYIRDNGKGLHPNSGLLKTGFTSLKYRTDILEGKLVFRTRPDRYFMVHISIPLNIITET